MVELDVSAIAAIVGNILTILLLGGGGLFWLGKLGSRVSNLEDSMRDFRQEFRDTRQEFHQGIGSIRQEFSQELGGIRQEFSQELGGIRQEIGSIRQAFSQELGGIRQEIGSIRQEFSQELGGIRQEISQEFRDTRQELLEAIDRSHRNLLIALSSHTHDTQGQAQFSGAVAVETPSPS